jgi:hypothetical protein
MESQVEFVFDGRKHEMEKLPDVDVPLLRKGVEWVLAESERSTDERSWFQRWWRTRRVNEQGQACGTALCLAGYICEMDPSWEWRDETLRHDFGPPVRSELVKMSAHQAGPNGDTAGVHASRLLGLTYDEANALFHESNTAETIRSLAREICESRGEELGL